MDTFQGFPSGKIPHIPIPDTFFRELLPQIDSANEFKVTLYFFWRLSQLEGPFRFLQWENLIEDKSFLRALAADGHQAIAELEAGLQKALSRGTLLSATLDQNGEQKQLFFLNSPKGRAAVEAIRKGEWSPTEMPHPPVELDYLRPNIYRLYEENIGPITPIIADSLRELEENYPYHWIEDAIRIAVENNKRSIRYAIAILERWQREGRDARKEKQQDRRDTEEARRKFIEGEFSEFIEH